MMNNKPVAVLGAALFLSLLVNVFLTGVIMGRFYHAPPPWVEQDNKLRARLSAQDMQAMKTVMRESRPVFDVLRKELDEARADIRAAVQSDDHEALDKALKLEREIKGNLLRRMQAVRAEAMQKLSPEGQDVLRDMGIAAKKRKQQMNERPVDLPFDLGGPEDIDLYWLPDEKSF